MAIDLIASHPISGLALGNVNGVDGFTKGGAGNDTLDVVDTTLLGGTQALVWTIVAGAGGSCTFYEQSFTARASGARWRFSFHVRQLVAQAANVVSWLSLCDAAFVEFVSPSTGLTTDGLRIGISGDGVSALAIQVNDEANPSILTPRVVTPIEGLTLNLDSVVVVDVNADDTYELWIDQGEGKISLTTGTLISGNTLIDRFVVWNADVLFVSTTVYYGQFYVATPRSDTKAELRGHRAYVGEITAATATGPGAPISITVTIYSAETGVTLATYDDTIDALSSSGEPKDDGKGKLDAAVQKALQLYGAYANVGAIVGHEVEF